MYIHPLFISQGYCSDFLGLGTVGKSKSKPKQKQLPEEYQFSEWGGCEGRHANDLGIFTVTVHFVFQYFYGSQ